MECLRLRVKDVEVRGGKGDKDRVLTLPRSLVEAQFQPCRVIFDKDREDGVAGVYR